MSLLIKTTHQSSQFSVGFNHRGTSISISKDDINVTIQGIVVSIPTYMVVNKLIYLGRLVRTYTRR